MRWWDGASWTAHVAPAPAATAPVVGQWGSVAGPAPAAAPRPKRTRLVVGLSCVAAALVVAIAALLVLDHPSSSPATSGLSSSPSASIDPGQNIVAQRAKAAGVPLLGPEGALTHTHTLLHVRVDGVDQVIPAGIGIDATTETLAAVHTHASTGVIHVESPVMGARYRLRQFLELWGIGSTEQALCQHFVGGSCHVRVAVVAPTAQDALTFTDYGPMPDHASTKAQGLDTELDQGAVIEIDLTTTSKR
jgi:hypothetical protein